MVWEIVGLFLSGRPTPSQIDFVHPSSQPLAYIAHSEIDVLTEPGKPRGLPRSIVVNQLIFVNLFSHPYA
jgi:hypothetical protein